MPAVPFEADLSRFRAALRAIERDLKKDGAMIVNKALKDVGMRAMQYTDFATVEDIRADLYKNDIGIKLAAKRLRKRGASKPDRERTKRGKIKKSNTWQKQVSRELRAIIASRKQGIKFRRVGWVAAINALGHSVHSATTGAEAVVGGVLRGNARRGYAVAATPVSPKGLIANAVYGLQKGKNMARSKIHMDHALQKAIATVTVDRENYRRKRIEATLKKHST